jgi:hypothetical protein
MAVEYAVAKKGNFCLVDEKTICSKTSAFINENLTRSRRPLVRDEKMRRSVKLDGLKKWSPSEREPTDPCCS